MDVLAYMQQCGADVNPYTTAAIMRIESGFNPLAINNNTLGRSYFPATRPEAETMASDFLAKGNELAVGFMQVHTQWLSRLGLKVSQLFEPCTNIRVGTYILKTNYEECQMRGLTGQKAMDCALTAYWSGRYVPGSKYVDMVRGSAAGGKIVRVAGSDSGAHASAPEPQGTPPRPKAASLYASPDKARGLYGAWPDDAASSPQVPDSQPAPQAAPIANPAPQQAPARQP